MKMRDIEESVGKAAATRSQMEMSAMKRQLPVNGPKVSKS